VQIGGVAYTLGLDLTYICGQMILNKYSNFVEKVWLDLTIFYKDFWSLLVLVAFSYYILDMLTSHARLPLQHLLYYANVRSMNFLHPDLHDLGSNGMFKITNEILYTFTYKLFKLCMKNYASFSTWSRCCCGCEMVTRRYMAQVLCVVPGYSFKFQFQTLIAQVNLQLEVRILNLATTTYGYLGLNSMEKDFSMVLWPLSGPHETQSFLHSNYSIVIWFDNLYVASQ
jgi:hypothetical protein